MPQSIHRLQKSSRSVNVFLEFTIVEGGSLFQTLGYGTIVGVFAWMFLQGSPRSLADLLSLHLTDWETQPLQEY